MRLDVNTPALRAPALMATTSQMANDDKPDDAAAEGTADTYMVDCAKFGKRMEGLPKPPLKGELGQRVYQEVSKEAWRMWLEHSKMLVNEYRLDLMSESGQQVWFSELEKYFWGEGSQLPPDFQPQKSK
jgi:Fe-S cluster biosynthesis and repair protein YggX